jgi:hypothetical protein
MHEYLDYIQKIFWYCHISTILYWIIKGQFIIPIILAILSNLKSSLNALFKSIFQTKIWKLIRSLNLISTLKISDFFLAKIKFFWKYIYHVIWQGLKKRLTQIHMRFNFFLRKIEFWPDHYNNFVCNQNLYSCWILLCPPIKAS